MHVGHVVLVTGAGSAVGRRVVSLLSTSGRQVRAAVGVGEAPPVLAGETVVGPLDESVLARACAGVNAVVHLAEPRLVAAGKVAALVVGDTARLLAALPDGCRVVLGGSTSVYGHDRPWPADVSTPPDPRTRLGSAHAEAERQARTWSRGEVVVVRLAPCYHADCHEGPVAAARWFVGRGVVPVRGTSRVHLLHTDDAAAGLVAALEDGEGTYLLAGPEPVTAATLLREVAAVAGQPPPTRRFPARVARRAAAAYERRAWRRDGAPPCTTADAVDTLTRDRAFSWARAEEGLGWAPRVTLAEGLRTP